MAGCSDLKNPSDERRSGREGGGADVDAAHAATDATIDDAAVSDDEGASSARDMGPDGTGSNQEGGMDRVVELAVGDNHCCAVLLGGRVRCWGEGRYGQLGYANTEEVGINRTPASAGDVNLGGKAVHVAVGTFHSCAILDNGGVRCWGLGESGALGYGNVDTIGDDEAPTWAGDIDVGGYVTAVAAGTSHTCALLESGAVRCWGDNTFGQLGYGNTKSIGDDEQPETAGDVPVGGRVVNIAAGGTQTCALLEGGKVRCWGSVITALGYGNTRIIGDDETPASVGDIDVGGVVASISAAADHTCAVLEGGALRCWGQGKYGALGYGDTNDIGDDETPAKAGDVRVGNPVLQVSASALQTCVVVEGGYVRCWGRGDLGALGYGDTKTIGDDEIPASAGIVDVGSKVEWIGAALATNTCALRVGGHVRCWGWASAMLGYGRYITLPIGDDESPATGEDVHLF